MPNKQLSDLPAEVTEKLPEGAQNIFLAAFNSAQEDGLSEQGAMDVAWNSVKQGYRQGEDGQWYKVPQDSNTHHKAVTSGGN
ncbi:MAG TPA: ChaB family protein [Cyanophyceae cyanobacterium]